jgi:hypothetical protein
MQDQKGRQDNRGPRSRGGIKQDHKDKQDCRGTRLQTGLDMINREDAIRHNKVLRLGNTGPGGQT